MSNLFKTGAVFCLLLGVTGCIKVKKSASTYKLKPIKIKEIKLPDLSNVFTDIFMSCEKPELDQEDMNGDFEVADEVTIDEVHQRLRTFDCDGKVKFQSEADNYQIFPGSIDYKILAEDQKMDGVKVIRVENDRSCKSVSAFDVDDKTVTDSGEKFSLARYADNGDVELSLTIGKKYDFVSLPVSEGMNHILVSYFGECTKLEKSKDTGEDVCKEREVLKTTALYLMVNKNIIKKDDYHERRDCKQR